MPKTETPRVRWKKITLVGVGLLGGSLGMALRKRRLAASVVGFVRRAASVAECEALGAVHVATRDLFVAVEGAELIVLCTPIAQMRPLVEQMLPALRPGAIVTDVGSVKGSVVRDLEPLVAGRVRILSAAIRWLARRRWAWLPRGTDLFVGAVCVVTPTRKSNRAAVRKVEQLWKSVGSCLLRLTPEAHDDLVSRSSHLPHVVAAQLARLILSPGHSKEQGMVCANGFRDTTRIASSSPEMWRDIALANRRTCRGRWRLSRLACKSSGAHSRMGMPKPSRSSSSRPGKGASDGRERTELPVAGVRTSPMPLPDLIEIVPLDKPVQAEITVPGSKSITNRALVLAALGEGETTLQGALWSEDTQVMVECLQELGFMVNVEDDPQEPCNRTITVYGKGGEVPPGGTVAQPLELFVGNAGTAARFLAAMVCLGKGVYRLHGVPRMHERPQAPLFQALRELGYRIESPNDKLPALIHGAGPRAAKCQVSIDESSQFASALLLCADAGNWQVTVSGENAEESPYVAMTSKLIAAFPQCGGRFQVEPDASSASYFWAAGFLLSFWEPLQLVRSQTKPFAGPEPMRQPQRSLSKQVRPPIGRWMQPFRASWRCRQVVSRRTDLGDSIMTAIVLAPFLTKPVRFTDLGRLRVQECERVAALRTELTKCGAKVVEEGDTLTVFPSQLHGAEIETYNDHRMAMCFAILGLKVPGIRLQNPACVKKTFPNFFQKLAAPPPHGLGAAILDGKSGRALSEARVVC